MPRGSRCADDRAAGAIAGPGSVARACVCCAQAAKVDKKDIEMLLLVGKCEEQRAEMAAAAAAGGGGKAEWYLAKQTYSKALKVDPDSTEAAEGLKRATEGMAGGAPAQEEKTAEEEKPAEKAAAAAPQAAAPAGFEWGNTY